MSTVLPKADAAFDPAVPGTAEPLWRELLNLHPPWAPRPGPLLIVSPHPDDEVLGAGGLMRMWSAWHRVTLLSITDGEAAYPDWPGLDVQRRTELERALSELSPCIRHLHLGLPDGAVDSQRRALRQALTRLCEDKPTLIAPFECDGHPDHDAAGEICLETARKRQLPIARYPVWAWHHRSPRYFQDARFGRFVLDRASQAAKARAIACFISQTAPGNHRSPIVPVHVLRYFAREFEAFLL